MSLITKEFKNNHIIYNICGVKLKFKKKRHYIVKFRKNIAIFLQSFSVNASRKKYKYIIPFGMNCDFSLSFCCYFGFVDSTFWNWVNARNVASQIAVMEDYGVLFSQGLDINPKGGLWIDKKTDLGFHARKEYHLNKDGTVNHDSIEDAKRELFSRMKYLYEKTNRYLDSNDKKLITYTIIEDNKANIENRVWQIIELYKYLLTRTQNFDFLVVCPRQYFDTVNEMIQKQYPDIYVRFLKSNYCKVSGFRMYGDVVGWSKLFLEFQPEKKQKAKVKKILYNQLESDKFNV